MYTEPFLVENLSNIASFFLASKGPLYISAQVSDPEGVTIVSPQGALVVVLAVARDVVESVAGAACGEPHTDEGAEGVVAPLTLQTVVLARHTLVDILALTSLLLETHRTRILLRESLRAVTGVITLSVDANRVLRAVVSVVGTFVDVNAGDQEEVVARGTLLVTTAGLLSLADVGAHRIVAHLVRSGAGVERLLALVHVVTDVDQAVILETNRTD